MPRLLYPRKGALVHIVQKVGWAPGPVWKGVEERKSPDPPAFKPELSSPHHLLYTAHLDFSVDSGYCPTK
jgi:hypothetical protein